ncbi:hypothetical protein Slin15195_G123200 [Septoria linicola]|uniref:Uncharacterized protein n=1 Tax=Septoria linicola TaxID=215465 RepID=A0A9Q9B8H5_9PEZI|nr:hypothetical protein Slin14017_G079400 [Septoria linicola]USW59001.1 hypothetical protein Slin15195_G123200 [Septoria linicola]
MRISVRRSVVAFSGRVQEFGKALTSSLQQELQQLEGYPVQVVASITFNVLNPASRENTYTVKITDPKFDADLFARIKTPAVRTSIGFAGSPSPTNNAHGRTGSVASAGRGHAGEVSDGRPAKPVRTEGENGASARNGSVSDLSTVQRVDDLANFMKNWHDEWTRQGGWLFDSLNGIGKVQKTDKDHLDRKLDTMQDVLGQSINSATAMEMTELANITKLIPWLEHCRKTNADKVQAREEKRRSSSATFHDQNRRERESAETRLEKKLEAQRQLLIKIAKSNGVDVEEEDEDDEKRSEASLGAQLTAELNSEARRAENENNVNSAISID